jgi:hypothetical protein
MEERDMSGLGTLIAIAALASTGAALAAPTHLNDSQYIAAAHCQGLYESRSLGAVDASQINSVMKSEGASRTLDVADRADQARIEAKRSADHAGSLMKSQLSSERDGACQVWAHGGGAGASGDTASR